MIILEEAEDLRRRLCVIAHAGGNTVNTSNKTRVNFFGVMGAWQNRGFGVQLVLSTRKMV